MGALLSCFSDGEARRQPPQRRRQPVKPPIALPSELAAAIGLATADRNVKARSGRKGRGEELLTHEQALAAAFLLQQQQNGGGGASVPFDRSASLRYPGIGQKKQGLPRSSSSRPRSLADPVLQPQQLVNQDLKVDNLETNHFVLVHGGGFGAWCWYKTIALLEDNGFKVSAIDLTGSGINSFDTNKITSLPEYVKPLTEFLEALGDVDKVILVGHDFGGACLSYAMEKFASKVAKAIFLCAAMPTNGQNTLDMFSQQADTNDLMQQAQLFVYANGKDHPPTAIDLHRSLLKELLFNQSPAKDVALALVSMRPIPFAPALEKLSLSDDNYGTVRRFYIETMDDNAIPLSLQQSLCSVNPPEKVFRLKGSDHSPFFSKPQALHRLLVEISSIPSNQFT
ncbi:methylesterase 11, chloroplastic [Canna indica]|uniref:Methylesterase 11, chloroplastic n=1 Tax=Canna indica TaxID=4628 RepID=A0AAQ3QA34_9LILI|nr:methylesterase 11, chloroplastic [Canna indica]